MRTSTLLLAGSVLLNAALATVAMLGHRRADEAGAPAAAAAVGAHTAPPAAPATAGWAELKADDLSVLRDRLRAEGFPPAMVRAIVRAQLNASFTARRKALLQATADTPYWQNPRIDPAVNAELRALDREERAALRALLGPDPDNGTAASLQRQFPNWSADKIDQLADIRERYDQQRQDIYSLIKGVPTPDDREKLAALDRAMHADFAGVLPPDELELYDLRTSSTANSVRYNVSAMDLTETEFRALYRLQKAFDDQWQTTGSVPPDQMRARMDAQKQLNAQIADALGAERYAEYQRATDYGYRQTTQLVARLGLPPQTANDLYQVQKDFADRRTAMFGAAGGGLSREQMIQQATALQQEATARVSAVLGGNANAVAAYQQYGGAWLKNMVPPPAPARPPGR